MPSVQAPVDDTLFLLMMSRIFSASAICQAFAGMRRRMSWSQILLEGGKICEEALAPLNEIGDEKELQAPRRCLRLHPAGLQGSV